jgi:hypothetical protein
MRWLARLATALFTSGAQAALTPDPTGLWFDPSESGWGLGLAQQGDTVFATLFVYDDAHRPTWYVASSVKDDGRETFAASEPVFAGTLYRTSGPVFSGAFDPRAVSSAPVGTLNVTYTDASGTRLGVQYTIDGIQVSKTLQRQTWGDNRALLPGRYEGGLAITDRSPFGTCVPVSFGPLDPVRAFVLGVTDSAGGNPLHIVWGTGIDTACTIDGDYIQHGQLGSLSGTLACGPIGSPLVTHPVQFTDLALGLHGFSGKATVQIGSCTYTGHIGGVRLP